MTISHFAWIGLLLLFPISWPHLIRFPGFKNNSVVGPRLEIIVEIDLDMLYWNYFELQEMILCAVHKPSFVEDCRNIDRTVFPYLLSVEQTNTQSSFLLQCFKRSNQGVYMVLGEGPYDLFAQEELFWHTIAETSDTDLMNFSTTSSFSQIVLSYFHKTILSTIIVYVDSDFQIRGLDDRLDLVIQSVFQTHDPFNIRIFIPHDLMHLCRDLSAVHVMCCPFGVLSRVSLSNVYMWLKN